MNHQKSIGLVLCGTVLGLALSAPAAQAVEGVLAQRCTSSILFNASPVEVEAYTINGHNYFKLRDIAQLADFGVFWNGESRTVSIDTAVSYTPDGSEAASGKPTETPKQDVPDNTPVPAEVSRADLEKAAAALGCWPVYEVGQSSAGELYLAAKYTSAYDTAAAHSRSFVDSLAGMSDAEKVRQIQFYVSDRLTYEASKSPTPAAVLASDDVTQGNCMSYANSVLMLCKMADIPCVLVHSEDHQWDQVYVDGVWRNVDAASHDVEDRTDIRELQETFFDNPGGRIYTVQDEDALALAKEILLSTT